MDNVDFFLVGFSTSRRISIATMTSPVCPERSRPYKNAVLETRVKFALNVPSGFDVMSDS